MKTNKKAMKKRKERLSFKKLNKNAILREVWVWPKEVNELIKKYVIGKSLHICSGLSDIGDVKLDLDPQDKSIIKGDMINLPFNDNSFDTVIEDPPWKIGFFQRQKPFFECVRVCKVDGRIIYNSTWFPVSKFVKLEKAILRVDNNWCNVSVIWIFKKIKDIENK